MNDKNDRIKSVYEAVKEQTLYGLIAITPALIRGGADRVEKAQIKALILARAGELKGETAVKGILRSLAEKDLQSDPCSDGPEGWSAILEKDGKGNVSETLNNYITILDFDEFFDNISFNVLTNSAERKVWKADGSVKVPWDDAQEVEAIAYIEDKYHIYSPEKFSRALINLFKTREVNPVMEMVESLPPWDRVERIPQFLTRWMKAEDTPYTQEVSRLIFAGGINRLYEPGCKFDNVPVLIGTHQGEGKSSLVRWLAIQDAYASEVTQFDGQEAIEQLEGAWICEVAELLALTKARDQEAVKAFITRQCDKYRKPYAKNTTQILRRSVMIGTTNDANFLRDKTGNRRFYPVVVRSTGHQLFSREKECREDIARCWAEARDKYKEGKMPPFADSRLAEEFRLAQDEAMEDDYRIGVIQAYINNLRTGQKICVRQLAWEALRVPGTDPKDPTVAESRQIAEIMNTRIFGIEKYRGTRNYEKYGIQRGWVKC